MTSPRFCVACRAALSPDTRQCPHCGAAQPPSGAAAPDGETTPSSAPAGGGPARAVSAAESGIKLAPPWDAVFVKLREVAAPRYQVQRALGYGGMAAVFMAEEPRLGRRVAIKVMAPGLMVDSRLVERFRQEARTIAQLSHPNIVTVYEVEEREGLHYFAMSYVPGRTLADVLEDELEPLPIDVVRAWLAQVGAALAYAHRAGVIHRDIKPGNILLDEDGNVLVTDFGIAKVADEPSLTRTGMLVGTPAYMSPEQCTTGVVAGASDQYSLGAVAYQMLTGKAPFSGPTMAVLQAHVTQRPQPIRELRPDCPQEVAAAVERMLEKAPDARWPSVGAAVGAMGATLPGLDDPIVPRMAAYAAHAAGLGVEDPPTRLREGDTVPLEVIVWDAEGEPLSSRRVSFESSEPSVAVVTEGRMVSALRPGTARITARCGHWRQTFEVTVAADPVEALEVVSPTREVARGSSVDLLARARSKQGGGSQQRAVIWASSNPAIARVSPAGHVEALGPGTAVITATSGEITAELALTVTEPELHAATLAPAPATPAPETPAPQTPAPQTAAPQTAAPQTPAPQTAAPQTPAPQTPAPATPAPQTPAPQTAAPQTPAPQTAAPQTPAPATPAPQTPAPATGAPPPAVGPIVGGSARGRGRRVALVSVAVAVVGAAGALYVLGRGGGRGGAATTQAAVSPPANVAGSAGAGAAQPGGLAQGGMRPTGAPAGGASATQAGAAGADGAAPGPAANRLSGAGSQPKQSQPSSAKPTLPGPRESVAAGTAKPAAQSPSPQRVSSEQTSPQPAAAQPSAPPPASPPPSSTGASQQAASAPAAGPPSPQAPGPAATPASAAPVGTEADVAAIGRAIAGFVAAFSARKTSEVVPLMPSEARADWRRLLDSRQVTQFQVTLQSQQPPAFKADSASVPFSVRVVFHNGNRRVESTLHYIGALKRGASGTWTLLGLGMDGS